MTDLTPPGPAPDDETTPPAPTTGGLPLDDWLAHQEAVRAQGPAAATPYSAYGPHAPPLGPPSKRMAGWALGLSLAFCIPFAFLVGFGLAIAVLVKSRDGRNHGKGMAIAAIVIAALTVIANIVYVVVYLFNGVDTTERDADGNVVEAGTVTVDRLRDGDCYNHAELLADDSPEVTVPSEVEVVPCALAHDFEVFAVFELPDGDFPGDKAVQESAFRCFEEFTEFNGRRWRPRSGLDFLTFMPTSASWRFGDRAVTCSIFEVDRSQMQDTIEGDAR